MCWQGPGDAGGPEVRSARHGFLGPATYREHVLEPLCGQHRIMLDRAIARGEIPAGTDREVVLDVLFGAAQHRMLLGHLPLTDRFVQDVVEVIMAGIQGPAPS